MKKAKAILPLIVTAQFCCTSLWFAGNAVMTSLATDFDLDADVLGHLTSAVQFGFIVGTLVFALFTFVDRFSPSKVFLMSALLGALFNVLLIWEGNSLVSILLFRFGTGFFLAGIYPVGMKIAADYYEKGLGKSLGFLVGALVLGTAFPHLIMELGQTLPWKFVLLFTSSIALTGGFLMFLFVPDGPFRKPSQQTDFGVAVKMFGDYKFRNAAFGYFGHMWELYAFWAFVPAVLYAYQMSHVDFNLNVSLLSFCIIGIGGLGCVFGGIVAQQLGERKSAMIMLFLSCCCCFLFPLFFTINSVFIFLGFLFFWGMVVVADSPLFSTLVAQSAVPEMKGTALTIVNCIGFCVTIFSIQLVSLIMKYSDSPNVYLVLAIGPLLGLFAMQKNNRPKKIP